MRAFSFRQGAYENTRRLCFCGPLLPERRMYMQLKKMFTTRFVARAAAIGAVYAALTLILAPISYGQVQLRVSEALTLLPVLTPAAVPGLFVGCLIANLLGSASALDVIFGSLATLLAALLTRRLRNRSALAALPPVVMNALIVGGVLSYTLSLPLFATMGWVGLGEALACFVLGLPLLRVARRLQSKIFE